MTLSVFATDRQTPWGVLQHCIDDFERKLTSPDEPERQKAADQLARHGDTVEKMVQNGWRVLRLPVSAFTSRGFTLTEPEEDGHQNVAGEYKEYSGELADLAIVVPEHQYDPPDPNASQLGPS